MARIQELSAVDSIHINEKSRRKRQKKTFFPKPGGLVGSEMSVNS